MMFDQRCHDNKVRVRKLEDCFQPIVCKRCWGRRAVNAVTIGATIPYFRPCCQPCTNAIITNLSVRIELDIEYTRKILQGFPQEHLQKMFLDDLKRRLVSYAPHT